MPGAMRPSGAILGQEAILFLLRGPAAIAIALVLLAVAYAGWSGDRWRDGRIAGLEEFADTRLAAVQTWRAELVAIEEGSGNASPFAANPMNIAFPATLPPGALGDFAVGHTDLHPPSGEISPWNNLSTIFGRYQFENPEMLAMGSFDVALVVIVVMPLLMIAVSFDLLSRERTRGTLALTLCAPMSASNSVKLHWIRHFEVAGFGERFGGWDCGSVLASFIRKLLPSMTTVSAWCSRRSSTAEVRVASLLKISGHFR